MEIIDLATPQILVDADACPVKDEVLRVAKRHGLVVTFVANFGLRPSRDPMIRSVMVPQGADAADDWIVEHAGAGDLVITSDIPLAGRALKQGATVMGPTGKPFTEQSIGMALAMRELNQHLDALLQEAGRKPEEVRRTIMAGIVFGKDERQFRERLGTRDADALRKRGVVAGDPGAVADQLARLGEAGAARVMLQWLDQDDLDGLEALAKLNQTI